MQKVKESEHFLMQLQKVFCLLYALLSHCNQGLLGLVIQTLLIPQCIL